MFQQAEEEMVRLDTEITILKQDLTALIFVVNDLRDRIAALEVDIPTDPNPEPTGKYLLGDLSVKPTSGDAWKVIQSWADKSFVAPDLGNQDNQGDVQALASALIYARTRDVSYREKVIKALQAVRGTESRADTLAVARFYAVPLAANLIEYTDASWLKWLADLRFYVMTTDRNYTLVSIDEKRPNNWRGHAGATRTAIDLLIGDKADLERAIQVFKGFLGDYEAYHGFTYGDLSWQADPSRPVGINPVAERGGVNLDGIIPDDMRRGGDFPTIASTGISYTYECLQGVLIQAELLHNAGYDSYEWSDQAVLRAFNRIYKEQVPSGDDLWQTWLINKRYGTQYPVDESAGPGKSIIGIPWMVKE